jgi:hypothetical protein
VAPSVNIPQQIANFGSAGRADTSCIHAPCLHTGEQSVKGPGAGEFAGIDA